MAKALIALFSFVICLYMASCQPEEEVITTSNTVKLTFSEDTITFDTVFTSIDNITQRFKAINPDKNAVIISNISLALDEDSPYTITVNGITKTSFEDIFLLGGDSLLILVSIHIDENNDSIPLLVRDSILFETNGNEQHVKLIAYGQDAVFTDQISFLCDTTLSSFIPYVFRDSVIVDSSCVLTIGPGAKLFFDVGAALVVYGTLHLLGDVENRILLSNSRLDSAYKNAFGQWEGIYFMESSTNNIIESTSIRNAVYGIHYHGQDDDNTEDISISNTIIENMSESGLFCINANVSANNTLINNCVKYIVANTGGGSSTYEHCTFANFGVNFFRDEVVLLLSSQYENLDGSISTSGNLTTEISNSIIWGNFSEEIQIIDGEDITLSIKNSLIKTKNNFNIIDLSENDNIIDSSKKPRFRDSDQYNYKLDTLSPAINTGNITLLITEDINGVLRDTLPDMGAYEWVPSSDE